MSTEAQKSTLSPDNIIGRIIGDYRISQRIRNSLVFLAFREESPQQQVALKLFYPDPIACNREIILERLHSICRLDHANILKVYEVGEEKDYIYTVMEYVPGENLYDLMQRNPRLHWAAAAELAREIVRGLVAAHGENVLHRCLHPDRILLGKGGQIKINFCNEGEITPSKEIANYVAPEFFLGKDLEAYSDIYSLGSIIFNIVTGKPPLSGKEPKEIVLKHRQQTTILPRYGVADIPHSLSLILARSLDVDPHRRYVHGVELQAALQNFLLNDIGHYKLGSYKQLLPKVVEVSDIDKAFTEEVERVQRKKMEESNELALPIHTDIFKTSNNAELIDRLHQLPPTLAIWCMLSLTANVALAIVFYKIFS